MVIWKAQQQEATEITAPSGKDAIHVINNVLTEIPVDLWYSWGSDWLG